MSQYNVGQYENAAAVVPNDGTVLPQCPAIYVGGGGNVEVVDCNGVQTTFTAVIAGTMLPVRVSRVRLTNLTASNMVACW